jgi:hypothetical protein
LEVTLEKLIHLVTAEVIKELNRQGVKIIASNKKNSNKIITNGLRNRSENIDMSKYRTPILTEDHLKKLHELTGEIVIPKRTILTPKAREFMKEKGLIISYCE